MKSFFWLDRASRPAALLTAGRTLGFVAAFAIPIVLARRFDLAEFGTYKQLFLVFGTLYGLGQLGIAESLYYFVPRNPTEAPRHSVHAILTLALVGLTSFVALAAFADSIAAWMANPELAAYLPLIGLFVALMLMSAPFEILLVSRQRFLQAAVTYAFSDVGRALFILVPVLLVGGLRWAIVGAAAFAALRFAAMIRSLGQGAGTPFRPDAAVWRSQLAYALPFGLAVGIEVVQATLHQYVVASRFDPATFAIYAVGCLQIPVVDVLATSSANVMMVKMAEDDSGSRSGALALWHDTICRLAMIVFPLTVFLLLAAHDVITMLFTASYAASVPIFRLWTLLMLPSVLCVDAVLRAYAQTRFLLGLNLSRLAIVAGLIWWFLGAFGLHGAVLVMLVSVGVARAAGLVRIARLLHVSIPDVLPWGRLAAIAAVAIGAAAPALWLQTGSLPRLAALAILTAVYGAIHLAFWYAVSLSQSEGPSIAGHLRSRWSGTGLEG